LQDFNDFKIQSRFTVWISMDWIEIIRF